MTLGNTLNGIEQLDGGGLLFAAKPWRVDSRADISQLDQEYRVPRLLGDEGRYGE